MKSPLLNPKIYNKINDSATSRDIVAQRKQRLLVTSTISLVKAVVSLKRLENDRQDKIPKDIKRKLHDVSPLLHKSLRLNNTLFTERQEKEKVTFINLWGKILNHMQNQTHLKIIYLMKRP